MSLGHFSSIHMDPTQFSSTTFAKEGELMEHIDETYGYQIYRYFHNNSGNILAKGSVLDWDASSFVEAGLAVAAAPRRRLAGVLQTACPVAYYGWALVYGKGEILDDAAVATDTELVVTTATGAGRVDDPAGPWVEDTVVGVALEADVAAGGGHLIDFRCQILCV